MKLEQQREQAEKRRAEVKDEERKRLKELHWMRCAKCGAELTEIEFRGVKVDKCFNCGGVYLDDGELEQLAGRPGWLEALWKFLKG
jgi:hypothetical protein